jgi:predicted ATPase/DNA-binding CsgD family transcriptional regulator
MEELSPREAEVLELVGRHLSNPQIAEGLYISVRTVESHVAALIRKLGVADRRTLVAHAAKANGPEAGVPSLRIRTNLPVPRSSFIGRQAEREQLHRIVLSEALVTLTGIGGCGKTRLALEVASDLDVDFADGVFFVDFSAVSDPTLVAQSVAGALRLQIVDPTPDALADYFADRTTLLVFDNCEHLLDACADVADAILGERCPSLRIFATSREPLGLDGERVFRVPSLDIEAEAVALFVERARSARPDLQINAESEATIAEVCRRLDGIPLAIELAASRATHLSLGEIQERLNDRFRLLVGARRRIHRQQTLTAALDWSYDLLGADEQLLLRRLAVFRGSFSLRAAEAVSHPEAMELLGSLVDKSLVDVTDPGGGIRYRLLESVRIYAEQKLVESGESETLRSSHRDYYLEWVESLPLTQLLRFYRGSGPTMAQMVTEASNLTVALEWCREQGRYDLCARIAVRMAGYWFAFVRLGEMMAWWRELDTKLPAEDRDHRAMAFLLRSRAAQLAGEDHGLYSAQASALADRHSWAGAGAQYLQAIYWAAHDPPRGDRLFERAFEMETSMGVPPDPPFYDASYLSRLQRATSRDEALALIDDWRADLRDSTPTHAIGAAFALYGDTRTALELKSRAEPPDVPMGQFTAELSQAVIASAQGVFDEAEQHLATLTSVVRDLAMPLGEAGCLIGFAKVALDRGDYAQASRLLAAVNAGAGPADRPFRAALDHTVYDYCTKVLGDVLDPETARITEAEGAALSLKEALDAELARSGTTSAATPAR